nr:hypothetical protein [Tanacetum cinerariifolium]
MRDEADAIRSCVAQTTAVIIELQAMEDQDEVHDSLLAAKDAKRGEESKLLALHEVIVEALEEIESQGNIVEMLDGEHNDVLGRGCLSKLDEVKNEKLCPYGDRVMEITKLCYVCNCYTDHELFSLMHECVVLDMCDLVYGWQINSCRIKAIVSYNFLRLKDRGIYSVKIFVVKPNKDEYRILKNDAYMLEFDGSTTIRKASVKAYGFVTYPFQLQDFDGIDLSDNMYLIDVAGYVTNVGRTNHLKSCSKNLDFHLANHRVVHQDKVYLSSTSSTVIYDDDAIPAIKALKKANSLAPSAVRSPLMESGQRGDGIPFMWERHLYRLKVDMLDNTTQAVVVMFNETATVLVNYSADSLMDTVDESLEDHLNLPPSLSNLIGTSHVMEIKSHTYYEYGTFKSFTCWKILPSVGIEDSVGSSNLDGYLDNQP